MAQQALARAREIGLDVHVLPTWYDVDDVAALKRLEAELRDTDPRPRREPAQRPRFAAHTAKLMRQLARERDVGAARAFAGDQIHA